MLFVVREQAISVAVPGPSTPRTSLLLIRVSPITSKVRHFLHTWLQSIHPSGPEVFSTEYWGCPLGWHKRLRHSSPFAVNLSTGRTTVQHSEFGRSSGGGLCGSATHQGITG